MRRYRIGLLAPEFPPTVGGMEEVSRRLARALSQTDDVVVYTLAGQGLAGEPYEQRPILRSHLEWDLSLLRKEKADGWCALNAGLIGLAPGLGRPFAAYCHGNDFLAPWVVRSRFRIKPLMRVSHVKLCRRVLRKVIRRSDIARGLPALSHVFTNSATTARLFEARFPENRAPISVVPPGIQSAFFQTGDDTDGGVLRILSVARLEPRKNIDGVLRALALLPSDLRWRYTIVGDGSMRASLERLSRELLVSDRVDFLGGVTDAELLTCYRHADLFILAAKATATDVEGFGLVYAEASASGVPVICSSEGGATDAVRDGVNGLVIPSSSREAIAGGIVRFTQSRAQFARSTVQDFARRFESHRVAAAFRAAFVSHL